MTLVNSTGRRTRPLGTPEWHRRSELDLAAQQLRAIERFNTARRMREEAAAAAARSREMRMDSARSIEVLRREHDALVARAHEQLRLTGRVLLTLAERRSVLAHRNAWFVGKVAHLLQENGVRVVAHLDNGADAVGLIVAEQPDVVLIEDTLAMVPGEQVVRDVRRFAPETLIGAQVGHGGRAALLLDAGAHTVFGRQTPPADVALSLLDLMPA